MMNMKTKFSWRSLFEGGAEIRKKILGGHKSRGHKDAATKRMRLHHLSFTSLELNDAPLFTSIGLFGWPGCLLLHTCLCEREEKEKERKS